MTHEYISEHNVRVKVLRLSPARDQEDLEMSMYHLALSNIRDRCLDIDLPIMCPTMDTIFSPSQSSSNKMNIRYLDLEDTHSWVDKGT